MCTLSFVPKADGFLVAMNRDEQRSRMAALPPTLHRCGELDAIYPSEQGGGTWIGANERGVCAALINWYTLPQCREPSFSRGVIIPRLLACQSSEEMQRIVQSLPLEQLNPFRLFLIRGASEEVTEYRCEKSGPERLNHPWITGHWFSSGHDEVTASRVRGETCHETSKARDAGTASWIQRLHTSHNPVIGPDSICMHRNEAQTVSMTMVDVSANSVSMSYHDGPPCESAKENPKMSFLRLTSR
jgi:Transport and Golgi organisation 2